MSDKSRPASSVPISAGSPEHTQASDDRSDAESDGQRKIKLTSSDNEEFIVTLKVARMSELMKNLLEDVGTDDDEPIPLPNVSARTLNKVITWCEYYVDDPEPDVDHDFEEEFTTKRYIVVSEWDRAFYDGEQDDLFDIILAANYLDIKQLLDLGCKVVADQIKGKTPQEIRDHFGIENDFTPEEEERIRAENEWAEI